MEGRDESIRRQLGGWINSLKDQGDQSPRYQTSQTRHVNEAKARRRAFSDHLEAVRRNGLLPQR